MEMLKVELGKYCHETIMTTTSILNYECSTSEIGSDKEHTIQKYVRGEGVERTDGLYEIDRKENDFRHFNTNLIISRVHWMNRNLGCYV